jgi:cytochrome P450
MNGCPAAGSISQAILANSVGVTWGADAQPIWAELAVTPSCIVGSDVLLSSTAAVDLAMHQPNVFSSGPEGNFMGSETGLIPLQIDPPEHARYRRMLDPLFSPRRVAALEAGLRQLVNACIDSFIDRNGCDFSSEFAVPFPVGTFLKLLGLPDAKLPEFIRLKEDVIRPATDDPQEAMDIRIRAHGEISALFMDALTEREVALRDDLLSALVERERSGDLSREESINIAHLLLLAGLDTVTGTLECAFALLAERPDLRDVLAESGTTDQAVEELLRWIVTSPAQARYATQDISIDGLDVKKGMNVRIVQAVLNFDEARFPNPLQIDLRRGASNHSSFGVGVHRCLGSHLARMEMRIALSEWHRRIPHYRLADDCQIEYTAGLRGVTGLKLAFD